nr:uncharacterized protein LOC117994954 [Maniola hyperantus]
MVQCLFKGCKNNSGKQNKMHGVTYHKFPSDTYRLRRWIMIIRKQRKSPNWQPSKTSVICSDHFPKEVKYYTANKGRLKLTEYAVPIIKLPNDMANYMQYRIQGIKKIRMKEGCLPSRFTCQPDRRRTAPIAERSVILKRQRKQLVEDALKDAANKETSKCTKGSDMVLNIF